ncbi:Uncharacterized protein APZ42_006267, partial [Daphnia magna]
SNCLAVTTEADHKSFESWEIPPQPLARLTSTFFFSITADSSSCSDLAVLEQTVASTRNSTIQPFPSQDATPKKKLPPFQRQKPVSHSDGKFGSSSHSSLTAVDGEFSGCLNGAADISNRADESRHGDTGSIVGDNGSTIRVTGSAKRGARASNRGSVTQNHRAGSLYGVVPQNDSGFLNDDDDWKKKMLESMTITNSILRVLVPSSVYVGNNLAKNIGYFRKTVEKNVDLPLKLVENVSALDNALIDINFSVSLVSQHLF